jgi:uncharacterized membrane protein YfcA
MDPFGLAICLVVVCLGAAIQGAIGFGLTFLSAPVLGLLYPDLVPAPLVLMSIPLVALVLWSNRAGVDWRGVSWALTGCAVGAVAAGFTIAALSKQVYELLFGCGLLVAVGMSLLGWRPAIHRGSSILAGLVSGFMATLSSRPCTAQADLAVTSYCSRPCCCPAYCSDSRCRDFSPTDSTSA